MVRPDVKFDFDDLLIVHKVQSKIDFRKEISVYDKNGMLPLFTAPMDTVIGLNNLDIFKKNKIYSIVPRTVNIKKIYNIVTTSNSSGYGNDITYSKSSKYYEQWVAYGLLDFENFINENQKLSEPRYILIDIAHGGMKRLHDLVKKAKFAYGDDLQLMVGNVANPETYRLLSEAGADYVRVGIGNGGGCWIEGTKVLTKYGYKNIEEVCTDDEALTHTGEWKPVILTHELDYYGDLIDINGEISTEDHQYFVVNKKDSDLITDDNYLKYAYWINAIDLTDEHLLLEIEKNDL